MKKVQVQAIFFTLAIMLPLFVTTISQIGGHGNVYELEEMPQNSEEQNDEKGSEEETCKDSVEEYLAHNYCDILSIEDKAFVSFSGSTGIHRVTTDVLTPPPEYI